MIFFCEDCGKKNILLPEQFKDGKAVFRCEACQYLNSYNFRSSEKNNLKKIESFFEEINACPEIIGSFLLHKKTGVLINNMPETIGKAALDILGKTLTTTYWNGHSQYPDVTFMTLVISNKNMIFKMIDTDLFIIIASKTLSLSRDIQDKLVCLVSPGTA